MNIVVIWTTFYLISQLVVIILAAVIAGFCSYGCYNLQTDIDIKLLFHPDSYALKFINQREAVRCHRSFHSLFDGVFSF